MSGKFLVKDGGPRRQGPGRGEAKASETRDCVYLEKTELSQRLVNKGCLVIHKHGA